MQSTAPSHRRALLTVVIAAAALASPLAVFADFEEDLARVDEALKKNPAGVLPVALDSCLTRRQFAYRLYNLGQNERAARSLRYCFQVLRIPEVASVAKVDAPPSQEDLQAAAAREVERALHLEPNVAKGLEIYRECAACHMPQGFGLSNGSVPQIAGQHRKVVIKQLADIRSGNRDNVLMAPYSSVESIGGSQSVADVAAYIDTLEISVTTGKGAGDDLELGKRLYEKNCTRCHGATGEGSNDDFVPRIQAQHYNYLVRQFEWIRDGKRRNSNPEMVAQIQGFADRETHAVLDYVSRLEPPIELQAPPGWKNPDFAD